MMEILRWYLSVGCFLYIFCFVDAVYHEGLWSIGKQEWKSIFRGQAAIFVWPLVFYHWRRSADEARVFRSALEGIARKVPEKVTINEAADMACEFKLVAITALRGEVR